MSIEINLLFYGLPIDWLELVSFYTKLFLHETNFYRSWRLQVFESILYFKYQLTHVW